MEYSQQHGAHREVVRMPARITTPHDAARAVATPSRDDAPISHAFDRERITGFAEECVAIEGNGIWLDANVAKAFRATKDRERVVTAAALEVTARGAKHLDHVVVHRAPSLRVDLRSHRPCVHESIIGAHGQE